MIKFFRRIRQKLLSENKFSKYLLYAIGEIILVVIGILIALQINTWNQERLNNIEKKELLAELHIEFKANKKALKEFLKIENRSINASISLINLIGATREELANHNLDSLLYESFPSNELAFANNAVNNIIQNGKSGLFKDKEINDLLYQWNALSEIRKIRFEKLDMWSNEQFIPYMLPYISLKEMDNNAGYPWAGKSKVKPDYYPVFQKIEFENLLDNSLWLNQQVVERLLETETLIDKIINTTKSHD